MIDAATIKTAVELLNIDDDSKWEADGTPKLSVLQTDLNNKDLTLDDVDEAIGAFKRPDPEARGKGKGKGKAAKAAETPAEQGAAAVPPVAETAEPDPLDPTTAKAQLDDARAKQAKYREHITAKEAERDAAQVDINELKVLMDEQTIRIETFEPRVSQAEAVKAIQRQTQERLANQKHNQGIAAAALQASGVQAVYPSRLDAVLATRKRSPEESKNYATYVHQQGTRRAEGVA